LNGAQRRLFRFRQVLDHARERLGLDLGFVLWDGSTVPAGLAPQSLAIRIADEGAVAALIRRPTLETLAQLWVTRRIDQVNGTLFDLANVPRTRRTRDFFRSLDKGMVLRALLPFLFVARGAGAGGPWPPAREPRDRRRRGDPEQNRRNVAYHYDVSNAFYALWLDAEMVYSCAYFTDWSNDLATAQRDKLDMICRKLRLQAGETLLDVGCGWGALVCHAARHYGVRAHGVTLAREQYAFVSDKVARLKLQDRVTIALTDYATLQGTFDKIASIGMFEHVGIDNHARYFAAIHRLLKPRGLYLHHAIARPAKRDDRSFRRRRPEYAALVRYIFPGGELDHVGMSAANLERHGFELHDVEGLREHYARTTRLWHDRLWANRAAAEREVGDAKTRAWLMYLAGCALAFERGTVGVFQTLASKRTRGASGLPPTRADLYR
jgi:cyclopropane-fatty-acyl-phospholipid synthase